VNKKLNSNTFKRVVLSFIETMMVLELADPDSLHYRNIWQELDLFYLDYVASYVERIPDDQI